MVGLIEEDEVLARVFAVANDQAFSRKRPVIYQANVCDVFAMTGVKAVFESRFFTEKLYFAILVRCKECA